MTGQPDRRSALGLMTGAALSACAHDGGGRESLEVWAMGREGEVTGEIAEAFARERPGVSVRVQQLPWTAAHAKLLTAFAGGSLPDVCQIGNTWLPEFAALGALEPLDARVQASAVIRQDDYFPGVWRTNTIGGRLLGVPWYVDTRLVFYRRDLFEQAGMRSPPQEWKHWIEAMASVQRRAKPGDFATLMPLNEYEPLFALALQQADPLLKDGGVRGNFQSPGFKQALAFYHEIFRLGLAPKITDTEVSSLYNEFARGRFASVLTGPWNLAEFARRMPPELKGAWATMPLPGPNGPGAGIAGGSSLVMTAASRSKPLAWSFIEHLSQPAMQVRFHALTGDLPPRRSAWNLGGLGHDPHAEAFYNQLERAKPAPPAPEWERIATEMQTAAEAMVRDDGNVDEAALKIDEAANRILEKRRWLVETGRARSGVA